MINKQLMQTTLDEIEKLREEVVHVDDELDVHHPRYKSILNLKQYLILRSKDRTALQEKLFYFRSPPLDALMRMSEQA